METNTTRDKQRNSIDNKAEYLKDYIKDNQPNKIINFLDSKTSMLNHQLLKINNILESKITQKENSSENLSENLKTLKNISNESTNSGQNLKISNKIDNQKIHNNI